MIKGIESLVTKGEGSEGWRFPSELLVVLWMSYLVLRSL